MEQSNSEKDWSKTAENFDELQSYVVGDKTTKLIIDKLTQLEKLGSLIEFGCGNGTFTRPLAKNAKKIVATDFSNDMVASATGRLSDLKIIQVEQADCYQTEYENESFDTVFMANLIHVVENPKRAIREANRILKQDGRLILVSFTMDNMRLLHILQMSYRYLKTFGKPPKSATPFRLKSLCDFVRDNGFIVEESELIGYKSKAIIVVANKEK